MITIIDYGVGNIKAFVNIYKELNIKTKIAKNKDDLKNASRLILPGVGAFDHAMQKLSQSGMKNQIIDLVINQGIPVLGVCVGMQMLSHSSDEGKEPGLSWVKGRVKKFESHKIHQSTHLPHMGWNDVHITKTENSIFQGMEPNPKFYFLHSYYFDCEDNRDVIAQTDYGGNFDCAVNFKNIYGVQFHPEKSHFNGTLLLKNFSTI